MTTADKVERQLGALAPGDEITIRFDGTTRAPMRARVLYRASGYTYTNRGILGVTTWAWMELIGEGGKSRGSVDVFDVSRAIPLPEVAA